MCFDNCEDLNCLVKEDKYKVMKILGEKCGYSVGTKGLKAIVDCCGDYNIDLNKLTDSESMKDALNYILDRLDEELETKNE